MAPGLRPIRFPHRVAAVASRPGGSQPAAPVIGSQTSHLCEGSSPGNRRVRRGPVTHEEADVVRVWLIRHGQSESNAGLPSADWQGIPLTELGHQQAERIAEVFADPPQLIVSSPYLRAQQTAQPTIARYPAGGQRGMARPGVLLSPRPSTGARPRRMSARPRSGRTGSRPIRSTLSPGRSRSPACSGGSPASSAGSARSRPGRWRSSPTASSCAPWPGTC